MAIYIFWRPFWTPPWKISFPMLRSW